MKKTALYIRVSTDAQYEEGYSVEAQKEKLESYCKLKDIVNYEFYIDGGWSGSNIDRPEMKRLINDVKSQIISAIVVYKLDRLSRSQKDTIFLLEDVLIPNNCNFISLQENFDTTTPYGKAMIGILSVFAQLERENIRERTRMGMHERVKSGLWMGGGRAPFGYDYDSNKNILVPNEHANEVKQIFKLYLEGYSTTQLANMFDVANDKHITQILDRITYIGKIKFRDEIFEGNHEAIIDEDTWNKVQMERKKRSTKNIVTSSYLLTGLVYCGKCGSKMRYQRWGKYKTKVYCYSQQTSKPNLVKDPNCDNLKIDACDLESIVIKDLFEQARSHLSHLREVKTIDIQSSILNVLQQRYNQISTKIKRLYNLYADNGDEILLETINENKKELNQISQEIENETKNSLSIKNIAAKYDYIKDLESAWKYMTIKEKQQAIRICIDRITVTDLAINISYKIFI